MASQQQVPSNSADVDSNAPGYPSVALTSSEEANADLDHILSAALDELEDEELGGGGGGGGGGSAQQHKRWKRRGRSI